MESAFVPEVCGHTSAMMQAARKPLQTQVFVRAGLIALTGNCVQFLKTSLSAAARLCTGAVYTDENGFDVLRLRAEQRDN